MTLAPGTRLGSYDIVSALGSGGMGEVYRAHDARLGRDVALKILPDSMARDPDALARFEREARAVAALNHPHIVTIYSTEEHAGVRFLTMEVVEGQTLDRLIPAGGIALDRFFDIAIALADALAAAHQKQITHRDLKPSNVMVTDDGRGDQAFVEGRAQRQVDIEGARILERTVKVVRLGSVVIRLNRNMIILIRI